MRGEANVERRVERQRMTSHWQNSSRERAKEGEEELQKETMDDAWDESRETTRQQSYDGWARERVVERRRIVIAMRTKRQATTDGDCGESRQMG